MDEEPRPLVEGEDYYIENGLMVLTAHYLRRRGYCCDQGCRNCPYEANENSTTDYTDETDQ